MLRFTVISREGCDLCDEMLAELEPHRVSLGAELSVVDVDSDPELQRRYGLKVPVLLLDGELVCYGRLDVDELNRLTRPR